MSPVLFVIVLLIAILCIIKLVEKHTDDPLEQDEALEDDDAYYLAYQLLDDEEKKCDDMAQDEDE